MNPLDKASPVRVFDLSKSGDLEEYVLYKLDIVDVIAEHIGLTRKGRIYVGRCPFHPQGVDRRIMVDPHLQKFMCYGCSRGDVVDFVAKREGLNRAAAAGSLAKKLGVHPDLLAENWQASVDKPLSITFAMLKQFDQCPLRYKYRYIDGKVDQKTTYYLALGRILHTTLAQFFRLDASRRSLSVLLETLSSKWASKSFSDKEEEQECKLRAEEMLTNYYSTRGSNVQTRHVEASIKCKIEGLLITGRVDRIDEVPGGYEIIDYKTEPFDSSEDNMNNMQLAFYYYGVVETFHLSVTKLTLEYLPSQETASVSPCERELRNQLSKALEILQSIRGTAEYAPKRNKYCLDCVLLPTCPEHAN